MPMKDPYREELEKSWALDRMGSGVLCSAGAVLTWGAEGSAKAACVATSFNLYQLPSCGVRFAPMILNATGLLETLSAKSALRDV